MRVHRIGELLGTVVCVVAAVGTLSAASPAPSPREAVAEPAVVLRVANAEAASASLDSSWQTLGGKENGGVTVSGRLTSISRDLYSIDLKATNPTPFTIQTLDVSLHFPLAGTKWFWDRTGRRQTLTDTRRRALENAMPLFGAANRERAIVAALAPENLPVHAFSVAKNDGMTLTFPLGFVRRGAYKWKILLLKGDPHWGYGQMWAHYYRKFAHYFTPRVTSGGLWLWVGGANAGMNIENVVDPSLFGHYEIGNMFEFARRNRYPLWAKKAHDHGILTYRYVIPGQRELVNLGISKGNAIERNRWGDYPLPAVNPITARARLRQAGPRNFQSHVVPDDPKLLRGIIKKSAVWGPCLTPPGCRAADRPLYLTRGTGWGGDSITFPLNPDPALGRGSQGYELIHWVKRYLADHPAFDGIYVDSLQGWSRYRNYRFAHLLKESSALAHDKSGRVYLPNGVSMVHFLDRLRTKAVGKEKLLFGNGIGPTVPAAAFRIDVLGTEATAIDQLSVLRYYGNHKPLLTMEADPTVIADENALRQYFARALALGIWPGVGGKYFEAEGRYVKRDRDLVNKTLGWISALNKAGWQPVSGVTDQDGNFIVNRFGERDAERIMITVFNPAPEARHGHTLRMNAGILGGERVWRLCGSGGSISDINDCPSVAINKNPVSLGAHKTVILIGDRNRKR